MLPGSANHTGSVIADHQGAGDHHRLHRRHLPEPFRTGRHEQRDGEADGGPAAVGGGLQTGHAQGCRQQHEQQGAARPPCQRHLCLHGQFRPVCAHICLRVGDHSSRRQAGRLIVALAISPAGPRSVPDPRRDVIRSGAYRARDVCVLAPLLGRRRYSSKNSRRTGATSYAAATCDCPSSTRRCASGRCRTMKSAASSKNPGVSCSCGGLERSGDTSVGCVIRFSPQRSVRVPRGRTHPR